MEISAMDELRKLHKEFTRCSICFDVYRQPKMLPCLHTFCFQCLEDFLVRSSPLPIACPLCRSDAPQTTDGLQALPTNFLIMRLIEMKLMTGGVGDTDAGRFVPCDQCQEGAGDSAGDDEAAAVSRAEMFCVECHQKLCDSCVAMHRKMKLSKGHQLVPLDLDNIGQLDQMMKNKSVNCEVHAGERVDFFCLTCSSAICMKCCMLQHKSHDYKDIAEVSAMFKSGLASITESVSTYMTKFQASSVELAKQRQRLDGKTRHIEELINVRFNQLLMEIDQQRASALEAMKNYKEEKTEEIDELGEDIQVKLETLESFKEFCQQLREKGSNYEVTKLSGEFIKRFKTLQEMSSDADSATVDVDISFKAGAVDSALTQSTAFLFGQLVTKPKEEAPAAAGEKPKKKQRPPKVPPTSGTAHGPPPKGKNKNPRPGSAKPPNPPTPLFEFPRNLSCDSTDSLKGGATKPKSGDSGDGKKTKNPQFTTTLVSKTPANKPVQGIAVLGFKLFVARSATPYLEIYDISDNEICTDSIKDLHVPGLSNAFDIAADVSFSTVYVSESMKNCVYRVVCQKNGDCKVNQFSTAGRPFGLSVNYAHNLLLACPLEQQVQEYSRNGDIVRIISTFMHRPRHVIEIAHNQFALLSGDHDTLYIVSKFIVTDAGKTEFNKQYGGEKTPPQYRLNEPTHLALDSRFNVILVADCLNHRVTALRADNLYSCGNITSKKTVSKPSRICFDSLGCMYVGSVDGQILKFALVQGCGDEGKEV